MTFCGWYTTPDYQPGTEVTGASGASDAGMGEDGAGHQRH